MTRLSQPCDKVVNRLSASCPQSGAHMLTTTTVQGDGNVNELKFETDHARLQQLCIPILLLLLYTVTRATVHCSHIRTEDLFTQCSDVGIFYSSSCSLHIYY